MPISSLSKIGDRTMIWHPTLVNIWGDCQIGEDCNIGAFVEIGPGVVIGNHVSIGARCFIPPGVTIEDDCFIGPGCTFTNDRYPPSQDHSKWEKILVKKGAAIGAASTILPGVTIGEKALIGAGSIVCRDIPAGWRVIGNPARRIIPPIPNCEHGEILEKATV